MPDISKINALAIDSVAKVDGLAKASILDIDGVAVPPALLLDVYPSAATAFSVRLLRDAYTGDCMRVRRSSDNVEADIAFDAGELKLTSGVSNTSDGLSYTDFADFVDHTGTPTDAFCRTWYDQSGYSRHAGQGTAGQQPKIYDATLGLLNEHGKPALDFDGTNDLLDVVTGGAISATNGFTAAFVTEIASTGSTEIAGLIIGNAASNGNQVFYDSSFNLSGINGRTSSNGYQGVTVTGKKSLVVGLWDWQNDTLYGDFDGVAATPNTNLTDTSTTITAIDIGVGVTSNYGDCRVQEYVVWPTNTLTIGDIADTMNSDWAIY